MIVETHHIVVKIYKLLNELQGRCREHITPGLIVCLMIIQIFHGTLAPSKMNNVLRLIPQKVTDEGRSNT